MATVSATQADSQTVLYGVPWDMYVKLRENPDNDHLRMTYDGGVLEIMAPSPAHGRFGSIIGKVVDAWADELGIPMVCLRDMTCKREDIEKGFEPDNCFYVQNEPRMWQKMEVDLTVDPPPDLAIEIEVSLSAVKKLASIYAAFGVPEVWRFDGQRLLGYEFLEGGYQPRDSSRCFPGLPLEKVEELVRQIGQVQVRALIRGFRRWVRERFAKYTRQGSSPRR